MSYHAQHYHANAAGREGIEPTASAIQATTALQEGALPLSYRSGWSGHCLRTAAPKPYRNFLEPSTVSAMLAVKPSGVTRHGELIHH